MGLTVEMVHSGRAFARPVVSDDEFEPLVDLGYDSRPFAPVETELGLVVALDEPADDKTLAVFGRAEARDFVDLHALSDGYSLDQLIELAAAKDAGFDRDVFPSSSRNVQPPLTGPRQIPSEVPGRRFLFFRGGGRLRPSSRHNRWIFLWLTTKPSRRSTT